MFHGATTYVATFHLYSTSNQKGLKVLSGLDSLKYCAMLRAHCFLINSWYKTLERRRGEKKHCQLFTRHIVAEGKKTAPTEWGRETEF